MFFFTLFHFVIATSVCMQPPMVYFPVATLAAVQPRFLKRNSCSINVSVWHKSGVHLSERVPTLTVACAMSP